MIPGAGRALGNLNDERHRREKISRKNWLTGFQNLIADLGSLPSWLVCVMAILAKFFEVKPMAYDPLKALQSAGVLQGAMPHDLEKAIAGLSQDEVDLIIAGNYRLPPNAPWSTPQAAAMSGVVAMSCMCGVWSGSGSGKAQ